MEKSVCEQASKGSSNCCAYKEVRNALGLLLAAVDHGEVEVEAREETAFTGPKNQPSGVQSADVLNEAGAYGDDRPNDTETGHKKAWGQFLEEHGPGGLESDVCGVEYGNGRRKFLGTGTDILRHSCCLDIA